MARKRKKLGRQKDGAVLDMTSMIDVVFLLLIFFMCATKFKMPEGALRSFLPRDRGDSQSRPIVEENCRIWLRIEGGQVIAIADDRMIDPNNELVGDFEIHNGVPGPNMDLIEIHISDRKETYFGTSGGLPVVIDFSGDVPWKYVSDVLNICTKLEIDNIAFAAPEILLD